MADLRKDDFSCINRVPIFGQLDTISRKEISKYLIRKNYKKDEYLYQAQDTTNNLYIIHTGKVRVFKLVESGKQQLIRILMEGDFLGEWTIFNKDHSHKDYAQAITDTSVCMLRQEDLNKFLLEYPEISLELITEMSRRLENSEKQTTHLATEQVASRLALYIADHVEADKEENILVNLKLSRKDIASYLGTTPETISRKFKELEDNGLIEQKSSKKILIHNLNDLIFYE